MYEWSNFSMFSSAFSLSTIFYLSHSDWYIVICYCSFNLHFPNSNKFEHLFTWWFAICVSSSVKCLCIYFALFLILLFIHCWCLIVLYLIMIKVLLSTSDYKINKYVLQLCSLTFHPLSWESDMTEQLHFHFSLFMHWRRKWQPLQCSCLENPRDGGAWWAAVYGVAQSRTRLKWLSSSSSILQIKSF